MSWMTILTMLVLAVTSAMLVMIYGWEPWQAFAVVSGGTIFVSLLLLAALTWSSPPSDRAGLWQVITTEMRKELKALFALFRGK